MDATPCGVSSIPQTWPASGGLCIGRMCPWLGWLLFVVPGFCLHIIETPFGPSQLPRSQPKLGEGKTSFKGRTEKCRFSGFTEATVISKQVCCFREIIILILIIHINKKHRPFCLLPAWLSCCCRSQVSDLRTEAVMSILKVICCIPLI